jgi:hypothetical protein
VPVEIEAVKKLAESKSRNPIISNPLPSSHDLDNGISFKEKFDGTVCPP